jgi:hypothetical protein
VQIPQLSLFNGSCPCWLGTPPHLLMAAAPSHSRLQLQPTASDSSSIVARISVSAVTYFGCRKKEFNGHSLTTVVSSSSTIPVSPLPSHNIS